MKHVLVIGDGMADDPLEELSGKTPLQAAENPNMDRIASKGFNGLLKNVPDGMPAESDVAIMSILGYDPREFYSGRGPLEAAGMDVEMGERDVAFRCNLITENDGILEDYCADHISTDESEELLSDIRERYSEVGDFYTGVDYRHLFVMRDADGEVEDFETSAPHKNVGERIQDKLVKPRNSETADSLNRMMLDSKEVLSGHPVNERRRKDGKRPANMIWVWGQGKKPAFEPISERFGLSGAVISAVKLVVGLGKLAGLEEIEVPGATGYYDTSYENKAKYGIEALEDHDLVVVHVEAPDEAGHAGDLEEKMRAIENVDWLLGRFVDSIEDDFKIAIMADHPTPLELRDHTSDPVPFAVYSSRDGNDDVESFDEPSAKEGSMGVVEGHGFMEKFLSG